MVMCLTIGGGKLGIKIILALQTESSEAQGFFYPHVKMNYLPFKIEKGSIYLPI